jgi:hypothetical protein
VILTNILLKYKILASVMKHYFVYTIKHKENVIVNNQMTYHIMKTRTKYVFNAAKIA